MTLHASFMNGAVLVTLLPGSSAFGVLNFQHVLWPEKEHCWLQLHQWWGFFFAEFSSTRKVGSCMPHWWWPPIPSRLRGYVLHARYAVLSDCLDSSTLKFHQASGGLRMHLCVGSAARFWDNEEKMAKAVRTAKNTLRMLTLAEHSCCKVRFSWCAHQCIKWAFG